MSKTNGKKGSVVQISKSEYKAHQITNNNVLETDAGPKFGCRHVQALLLGVGMVFGVATRTNLSVAIVAMTDNTTSLNPDIPAYDWDNTSIILSSFFWSYISLQIVAGYVGKTYGPKYFLFVALLVNYGACAFTPLAAGKLGSTGVLLCRIMQGFGQGFLFPSVQVLLGKWAPTQERTTLFNITVAGVPLGNMFSSLLTGYVSASWWGWPATFYILAILGVCWCFLWLCFGQNSPATDPNITEKERNYIQTSLTQKDNINLAVPWKEILTSVPFYALLAGQVGNTFGWSILMTETPTYLAKAMDFDVKSNAVISAISTAVSLVGGLIMGPVSDWIISRKFILRQNSRRIFNLIGSFGQAGCIIWLSLLQPSQASSSVFALIFSHVFTCFVGVGSTVNHLDLSPRFSGVLYGIVSTFGQSISLIGPVSANWIVTDLTRVTQWRLLFLMAAGSMIAGSIIFYFFSSASRQSWDGPENEEKVQREKKVSVVSIVSM